MTPNDTTDPLILGMGERLDCLRLDWREHKRRAFNSEPLELPPTLEAKLLAANSIDCVADDLSRLFGLMTAAIRAGGYNYVVETVYAGGDDTDLGSFRLDVFYRTDGYHAGDPFYTSDSFVVVNLYEVYALQDNDNVAECGILDCTLGYWLSPLRDSCDASLLDSLNDKLSAGYSSYPYGELESALISGECITPYGDTEPRLIPKAYWSASRQCYVCRVNCAPYLCKVEPVPPYYGG